MEPQQGSALAGYTVNRTEFSVPADFKVLRAEGFGAYGDSVRATRVVRFRRPTSSASGTGGTVSGSPTSTTATGSYPPLNASGSGEWVEETRAFIVRKFGDIIPSSASIAAGVGHSAAAANTTTTSTIATGNESSSALSPDRASASDLPSSGSTKATTVVNAKEKLAQAKQLEKLWKVLRTVIFHQVCDPVPGVLPLYTAYRDQQWPRHLYCVFPAMECTLADVIYSSTPLTTEQAGTIFTQLLLSVGKLHALGLVLGDLRPEWVHIDPQLKSVGCVSIANTSCLHLLGETVQAVFGSEHNAPPSTDKSLLWYRAPEISLHGVNAASYAADIWTLGCLLAEMLLRRPLFECDNDVQHIKAVSDVLGKPKDPQTFLTETAALNRVKNMPPKDRIGLASSLRGLPFEVVYLLDRMLVWNPAERITIKELRKLPFVARTLGSTPTAAVTLNVGTTPTSTRTAVGPGAQEKEKAAADASALSAVASELKAKWTHVEKGNLSSMLKAVGDCTVLL